MKKKLSILLTLALLLGAAGPLRALAAGGEKILRVGLAYNSNTVAAASLRNKSGGGFSLGYYDESRQLVPLAWTDESQIAVLITQNLYLTGSGGYSYSDGGRGAVGCFHVQLPGEYGDFASAQEAARQVENGFVAWIDGVYRVRAGSYTRRAAAEEAAAASGVEGAVLGETSGFGYSVVADGSTRVLFQFDADRSGETGALGVVPAAGAGEKAVSVYNGGRSYYGGFRFERIDGGESTVVNLIGLEDYIKGVVPYEMSPSWPLEALKAQAVCARTYASNSVRHGQYHFDLCDTTDCQAYKGTSGAGPASDQAVEETRGQLAYYNGKLIEAVYYSSNGGASEDVSKVWGTSHDYLKGKLDPYEADVADIAGNYHWSVRYTASELQARMSRTLKSRGYDLGDLASVTVRYSDLGNAVEMQLVDTSGKSYTISRGDTIRTALGTNSIRFTMQVTGGGGESLGYPVAGASAPAASLDGLYAIGGDGAVSALPAQSYVITGDGVAPLEPMVGASTQGGEATYTFTGTGWGHNVGMSQWGAYAMAKRGYTYLDILQFYYTGITVE